MRNFGLGVVLTLVALMLTVIAVSCECYRVLKARLTESAPRRR